MPRQDTTDEEQQDDGQRRCPNVLPAEETMDGCTCHVLYRVLEIKDKEHGYRYREKYHKKGFEIYGVSFDSKAEAWKNAIKKQNMKWVNVSLLQSFKNTAVQ